MPDQIMIGNFSKGLKTNREAFNIDNDAFPTLYNFYIWRGKAKRKRGTQFLGQLQRQIQSVAVPDFTIQPWIFGPLPPQAGLYQLITGNWPTNTNLTYHLESTSSIVPGSINVVVNGITYTDPTKDGFLTPTGTGGVNTINYATGAITIPAAVGNLTGTFSYYPGLPVMGLADFDINNSEITNPTTSSLYPILLAFDTKYSYQINQAVVPPTFYNTTFYKNTGIPFVWSGQDFQLFWTTNYSGALWATNNTPGLNILFGTFVAAAGAIVTFNFFSDAARAVPFQKLIVGDVLWFNEWPGPNNDIDNKTGIVSAIVNPLTGTYQVTFSFIPAVVGNMGISQMLTNTIPGQDGIKWYDGDPTATSGIPTNSIPFPTGTGLGWVNFAPPLTGSAAVSIDNKPEKLYYLVGALAILPFKDRLLVFSPWIKASTDTLAIQLIDTVLWSWNGTPYYTVSDALSPPTPSLVPKNQTANVKAWYVDQTGLGGYLPAGIDQPIKTVSDNEDVLLIGFGGDGRKTRFAYTGNDLQPFLFYNINSELPSSSTFSAVALDKGVIDIGQYGIAMTDQQSSERIDLDIPDSVFEIQALNNGADRVNSIRDFFREWIYFSYPVDNSKWKFPTQTFLFNYRDNTWAIFYENFTVHGNYRPQFKKTWQNLPYKTWNTWRAPWNSGSDSPLFTKIIAGNPQGYVLFVGEETTGESISGTITAIASNGGVTQITSFNHCVKLGDFIYVSNGLINFTSVITAIALGTTTVISTVNTFLAGQNILINNILGTTELNGRTVQILSATATTVTLNIDSTLFTPYVSGGTLSFIFPNLIGKVTTVIDANNFVIDIPFNLINPNAGVYLGKGKFTRLSQPLLQTKMFPAYWGEGRKVRLGVQKYLFDKTESSQVTINISLSQDPDDSWNDPLTQNKPPNGLVYSQLVYTCQESTNIGLTPANTNLQMPTGLNQQQIWHRFNTSMIGDTVQIGVTLNEAQMKNLTYATAEISLHGIHIITDRAGHLA